MQEALTTEAGHDGPAGRWGEQDPGTMNMQGFITAMACIFITQQQGATAGLELGESGVLFLSVEGSAGS